MSAYPLSAALLRHLPHTPEPRLEETESLLQAALDEAQKRWQLALSLELFWAFLSDKIEPTAPLDEALARLHLEELYLSCACTHQQPEALEILQREYFSTLDLRLPTLPNAQELCDEIKQQVWQRLCLPGDGTPSDGTPSDGAPGDGAPGKIAQYAGLGSLRGWLQTVLTREALGSLRRHKREKPLDEELYWRLASPETDQEQLYLKQLYRDAFKRAFEQALASLSPKDRTLLKYHYIDGLNIDKIGLIHRVHRATVARWLSRIRESLLASTHQHMHQELGLSQDGAQSIYPLIQSQLELSIIRLLHP